MRNWWKKLMIKTILAAFIATTVFSFAPKTQAGVYDNAFPKLANYYLGWDVSDENINELANWDLVIISNAAYTRNPSIPSKLRAINPDIVILVYVVSQEALTFGPNLEPGNFFKEIYETASANDWWLYKNTGQTISTWPQANWINLSNYGREVNGERFTDWLARRTAERFLQGGEFDGVFYDNIFDHIVWASKEIDINRDGQIDQEQFIHDAWKVGVTNLIEKTRAHAPGKLIIANTNSNYYNSKMNGRMMEHFPKPQEGGWQENLKRYTENGIGFSPKIFILNANNQNIPDQFANLQKVRFTYTSSLLGDGMYSYTIGDQTHTSTWWYDEYSVYLGAALNKAQNNTNGSTVFTPGVFRRDFSNGTIFVNSTNQEQTINLGGDYEKIKGTQAPDVNNGAIIRKLVLKANDGIILRKQVSAEKDIVNAVFQNGSFIKPFDKAGTDLDRNGFFLFDRQETGNKMIARIDLEKDGLIEKVVADNSKITIYNTDGTVRATFYPYGNNYKSGITFDIGDVDNDGNNEIVTGTMRGGEPLVKVFTNSGAEKNKGFYVFNKSYRGGVNVALANLNGNGKKDIVVGAGYMGGPQVRIFDGNGKLLSGGFYAYDKNFRGGVYVAAGDIDGNGKDEIITGAGYGGSTHVRMFDGKTKLLNPGFFAFGKESRQGVKVFVADLDGDGKDEILAANPNPF